MDLKLSSVPFDRVQDAQRLSRETTGGQHDYNTNGHSLEAIKAALPSMEHMLPDAVMPWVLLQPWLDLVMESQGIRRGFNTMIREGSVLDESEGTVSEVQQVLPEGTSGTEIVLEATSSLSRTGQVLGLANDDVHKIELPQSFLATMAPISNLAFFKGHLSGDPEDLQFLADSFPKKTVTGLEVDQLLQAGRYFARLDTCSLKDALVGNGWVKDSGDLWKRLATSMRAAAGLQAMKAAYGDQPTYLYLLKWNDKMRPSLEYRIFCAPGSGSISAISQYRWFEQWYHSGEPRQRQNEIAKRVYSNAKLLHQQILVHPAMTDDLKRRGFVFDILEDPESDNSTSLIELNDFGAMTGCGSCLFHWLEDARVLYGLEEAVTFRVTV